ncbi:hypothetical protein EJ06DRAFT_469510 [Trichodelitschia bisporula]|uniref:DUF4360 domain-containing protein n=1 Tax=Trichodelitschia bisporula TaxID=703511 RepID=A0A6G1I7P5_9PEZI|nr:hypothetical protein EJ06DRAFT_469510 [Trichodelitschia bisporula]
MKFTTIFASLAALAAAAPLDGAPSDTPRDVRINGVNYGGTGCPQGTVSSSLNSERTVMTLIFDVYAATIGPKAKSRSEARRYCQLNLKVQYPGGYQFSVFKVDTRGYADLEGGVTGEILTTYYFSGESKDAKTRLTINGPQHATYRKSDSLKSESMVWSPCGKEGLINIKTEINLTSRNDNAGGLLTVDSIDAKFEQKFNLQWRSCNKK